MCSICRLLRYAAEHYRVVHLAIIHNTSALTSIHVCKCNFLPFQNKDICSNPKRIFLKTNLSRVLTCEKYLECCKRCKTFTAHLGHTVCRALDHFFLSSGNSCHRCLMWGHVANDCHKHMFIPDVSRHIKAKIH